jgi:hypothetical protein
METGLLYKSLPAPFFLGFFFWGMIAWGSPPAAGSAGPVIGGPCEYKSYKGRAQIITVRSANGPGETGKSYEVTFSFQPESKISEPFAQTEGRTFQFTLKNGSPPSQKFLEKYRIEPGRIFDCTLQVITRGSCTPTLFEFAGIDRGDYGTR